MPQPCNLLLYWKKIPTQVFFCEFCETFKNTFFYKASLVAAYRRGGRVYFCNEKLWLLYISLIQKIQSSDREHLCQISKAILRLIFCVLTSSHYTKQVIKYLEKKQPSRNLQKDLFHNCFWNISTHKLDISLSGCFHYVQETIFIYSFKKNSHLQFQWALCLENFCLKNKRLHFNIKKKSLTLSWRRPLSYRNCSRNQWTGFYMITASALKELSIDFFLFVYHNRSKVRR